MGMWDDDPAAARSGYVTMIDLFVLEEGEEPEAGDEGRLLLIKPLSTGERESKSGDPYTYVECDIVILDGPPTDMIPEIPQVIEGFQFAGVQLVQLLTPKIRTGRSVLGRIGAHKAKNFRMPGWHLSAPTDEDFAVAKAFRDKARAEEEERAARKTRAARARDPHMAPGDDEGDAPRRSPSRRGGAPWEG
jgi:hypothetical protein